MQPQSSHSTNILPTVEAALRGGAADGRRDAANSRLTPVPASRVYNWPAASGQRPAASGQRHDVRPAPGRGAQAGFPDIGGLQTA